MDDTDNDVEPTDSARIRQELERLAFSRPEGADDNRRALEAQESLRALNESPPPTPATATELPADGTNSEHEIEHVPTTIVEPIERTQRRRRNRLLVVSLIAALAVGVALGHFAIPATSATFVPSSARSSVLLLPAGLSATMSTKRWFRDPQSGSDKVPDAPIHSSTAKFSGPSTRLVDVEQDGGRVWVAKASLPSSGYCLIYESAGATGDAGTGAVECAPLDTFRSIGVTLVVPGTVIAWDDQNISVSEG